MTDQQRSDQAGNLPLLAADGVPLKRSLSRALRRQKLRALMLIAPLLAFVMLTFVMPIGNMLFRSVQNDIVSNVMPYTVSAVQDWDPLTDELPDEAVFAAAFYDLFAAAKAKEHTRLGSRLNYEQTGISSLFRRSGRSITRTSRAAADQFAAIDPLWQTTDQLTALFTNNSPEADNRVLDSQLARLNDLKRKNYRLPAGLGLSAEAVSALPLTAREYSFWALFTLLEEKQDLASASPWGSVYVALSDDLQNPANAGSVAALSGPQGDLLRSTAAALANRPQLNYQALMGRVNDGWANPVVWETIKLHSPVYTEGYFLNAVDLRKTLDGPAVQPESKQILLLLFQRTVKMSAIITISCILLGYPVAWLLANLPLRVSNLLMILVLLPFWTSLLVRTSAWKVMLQQQGVINEVLVWLGVVATDNRLEIINNQFGTIVAMTHILLPFMILPMYSVMQTIPPSYVKAAKSLGATNWTAFWRVYFPQSVPGIGAGSILVFILSIGYYITPEIVGGTEGVFISNRIAFHISSSLNWGLAAALGAILLAVVLVLYWAYDRIVGIDNVKLG